MAGFTQLRAYQFEVFRALLRGCDEHPGETFTVMFPRQAGKNELSAALVSCLLLQNADRGGSIVVCAPTLYPQASLSLDRTASRLRRLAPALGLRVSLAGNIIRCGAAFATFLSGSPEANVAGHSASLLLIGDEAQDIDQDWFDRQFRPMTATTGASTVLFGTPWQGDSLLERAADANRRRDAAQSGTPYRDFVPFHHEVTWQQAGRHMAHYARFVGQERARLGPAHPIYLSQFELTASTERGQPLLSAAMRERLEGEFTALPAPAAGERYVGGLDFGGEGTGADATVLVVARVAEGRCEVVFAQGWLGQPFEFVTRRVAELARAWRLETLLCDNTGLGAPLVATLKRELGRSAQPFTFSQGEKSALGFELQAAAATGGLRIAPPSTPGLRALWDELRTCQAEPRPGGYLGWGAPAGAHDDYVAALALCLRAAGRSRGPRVAVGGTR